MPTWDSEEEFFKTRRWFRVLIIVFVILSLILIGWVLSSPIKDADALPLAVGANLTIVLAPVLAAATAVERTLESVFNMIGGSWHTMVAYLGRGMRWLKNAESNLAAVTSSDSYISAKAAASIVLGLMLGVIIAEIGQLQMFAMLGVGIVPAQIDVLITGLVISSGSYPIHALLGILQQGKGTVDSVKGYINRLSPEAQATRQKITTVQSISHGSR